MQSEAMSGFENDVRRIIEQWKPDANEVLELRFKPYWDNHAFPRRGQKQYSLLLSYVNDSVLRQQNLYSPAMYLLKTSDGWVDYNYEGGRRIPGNKRTFIKDSAGYRIEKHCYCTDSENCCTLLYYKFDSLNRVIESQIHDGTRIYFYKTSYFQTNKIHYIQYCINDGDTSLYYEWREYKEPFIGQQQKIDSIISIVTEPEAREDTVTTTSLYEYNKSGKIIHIKRIDRYTLNGRLNSDESDCYVIYRKRYPKRLMRHFVE